MSFRNLFCISVTVTGLIVPASADGVTTTTPPAAAPIVRTFLFPATGFSVSSETVRVTVVNIAPAAHNGTPANCTGNVLFADSTGTALQPATPFTAKGTGAIATVDLVTPDVLKLLGGRGETQASVQVNVDPKSGAPCSLVMTLEVYDTKSSTTNALVTTAIEKPAAIVHLGLGRGE